MSAVEAIKLAKEQGVDIAVEGHDLVLHAQKEPAPAVLEALKANKPGIINLLGEPARDWCAADWWDYFEERAAIAEFDGEQSRSKAEAIAFECCIVEWLRRHSALSDAGHCAHCGLAERHGAAVLPFGGEETGHAWLHPECWGAWHQGRREAAEKALKLALSIIVN